MADCVRQLRRYAPFGLPVKVRFSRVQKDRVAVLKYLLCQSHCITEGVLKTVLVGKMTPPQGILGANSLRTKKFLNGINDFG
jgi:hypothetical protein